MTTNASTQVDPRTPSRRVTAAPVLSYGFRPFFLFAGIWAAAALVVWMLSFLGHVRLPTVFDPMAWHAHEMLFGFAVAAAAGFILTAVSAWTGRPPVQGGLLLLLALLWLAGRVAVATSAVLGGWTAAIIDVAFLSVLTVVAAREICVARNWRNLPVVVALAALGAANGLFHAQALTAGGTAAASRMAIALLILLIFLIGGRIIPAFTRNWLVKRGEGRLPASFGTVDKIALAATLVALASWVVAPEAPVTGATAAVASVTNLLRLLRWAGERTGGEPLLAILHLGYLWLPVGFALLAGTAFDGGLPASAGLHALTGGAIATMILAVMTRATLGHTGRDLHAGAATTTLYALILLAAICRVVASLDSTLFTPLLAASAVAWVAAFGLFVALYGPMLVRPRLRPAS